MHPRNLLNLDQDLDKIMAESKNQEGILKGVKLCQAYLITLKSEINKIEEIECEIEDKEEDKSKLVKPSKDSSETLIKLEQSVEKVRKIKDRLIEKAQKLPVDKNDLQFVEELVFTTLISIEDRVHLAGHILEQCRKKGISESPKIFNFLSEQWDVDKKEDVYKLLESMKESRRRSIPNVRHFPRSPFLHMNEGSVVKDVLEKTIMYPPDELSDFQVIISKGLLQQRVEDHFVPFDTSRMISHGKEKFASFIINAHGQLFLFKNKHGVDRVRHSSMSTIKNKEGKLERYPVMAAGELCVNQGKLLGITANSGHYQPTADEMYQLLKFFDRQKMSLKGVKLCIFENIKIDGLEGIEQDIGQEKMFVYDAQNFYDSMRQIHQQESKILVGLLETYIAKQDWKVKGGGEKIRIEDKEITVPATVYIQWKIIQDAKGKESKHINWEDVHYSIKKVAEEALLTPKTGFFGIGKRDPETIEYLKKCSELSVRDFIQDLKKSAKQRKNSSFSRS